METEGTEGTEVTGGEEVVETTDSQQGDSGGGESLNPAWNPLIEKLPSEFIPMVTPVLRDWDKNFQTKLQEVQSPYEPYKEFVDNKVDPEALQQAFGLYQLMNENPQLVYDQMQQFYGFGADGQGQGAGNEAGGEEEFDFNAPDADITQHPKFQELAQNQQLLAQALVQRDEQERLQALSTQIDSDLAAVVESNPGIDEVMVLQIALANGVTVADAAKQLTTYNQQVLENSRKPAPKVFNGSGGTPPAQQPVDPTKMNNTQTKKTVAEILAAAHQAENGA